MVRVHLRFDIVTEFEKHTEMNKLFLTLYNDQLPIT